MPEAFDPYYKWLAIPPKDQPPNHYRLLGVELFEADGDVIANAADSRMAQLRLYQTGGHVNDAQRLLNEVASARTCLLNTERKVEYDEQLRAESGSAEVVATVAMVEAIPQAKPLPVASVDDGGEEEIPESVGGGFPAIDVGDEASQPAGRARPGKSADGGGGRPAAAAPKRPHRSATKIKVVGHIIAPLVGFALAGIILFSIGFFDEKPKKPPKPGKPPVADKDSSGNPENASNNGKGNGHSQDNTNSPEQLERIRRERLEKLAAQKERAEVKAALEAAIAAGNIAEAVKLAGKSAELNGGDILQVLQKRVDTFEQLQSKSESPEQFKAAAETGLELLDDALSDVPNHVNKTRSRMQACEEEIKALEGKNPATPDDAKELEKLRAEFAAIKQSTANYDAAATTAIAEKLVNDTLSAARASEDSETIEATRVALDPLIKSAVEDGNIKDAMKLAGKVDELGGGEILKKRVEIFEQLHSKSKSPAQFKAVAEAGLGLLDEALKAGQKEVANKIAIATLTAARASKDSGLTNKATQGVIKVQRAGG